MESVRKNYKNYKNDFMLTPIDPGLYWCVEGPGIMLSKQLRNCVHFIHYFLTSPAMYHGKQVVAPFG